MGEKNKRSVDTPRPQVALVTGGGGFLGQAIVRRLLECGYCVSSFSRRSYPALQALGVKTFQGDIAEPAAVKEACAGCDVVFHAAAKAGIWGPEEEYYRTNVIGTENVIESCRSLGISRLIYTSSPSVVFKGGDMESVNESVPYASRFLASYPKTKCLAERTVLKANGARLATVALRPHLIWGPGDPHIIPGLIARARQGKLRRIGERRLLVDFTYVDDAAQAHLLAAQRLAPGSRIAGRAFFISQGQPVSLWDFVNQILEAAEVPPISRTLSPTMAYRIGWLLEVFYKTLGLRGEPPLTRFLAEQMSTAHWFDIRAARRELGYQPSVSTEEGLERLRTWLQALGKPKPDPPPHRLPGQEEGLKNLTTESQVDELLEGDTAVIFKHSTRCPSSDFALREVRTFGTCNPEIPVGMVLVVEDRPLSRYVERKTGVRHESPQALVVRQGAVLWHGSHSAVKARLLQEKVAKASS